MAGAAIGGVVKPLVFVLLLAPFGYGVLQVALIVAGQPHELGADPAKALVLFTGEWSIRLMSARMPGAISPRSWKPTSSAVARDC